MIDQITYTHLPLMAEDDVGSTSVRPQIDAVQMRGVRVHFETKTVGRSITLPIS
jgi:hypothetical protein